MRKYLPYLLLSGIVFIFFYKTVLFGMLPFPGDLLLAGYAPWNHQSYDGYVAGAIPTKNQYFDVIRELYPWKTVVVSELKRVTMPLWNPYNFSGAPLLANYQSQVFYPPTLLYFVLPQKFAWTILVIIQPLLGSLFMYLFATEIGISSAGALIASILFNFSSFANVWMEFTTIWQTIIWLPLLLYLVERNVKQKKLFIGQQALFIFALFSSITAGHPQDFINLFVFLVIYTLIRKSAALLPLMVIPFLLAAVQLAPTVELFRDSARVAHDYTGIITHMLVQWWQFPLIAVSDFFGNPATNSNFTGDYVGKTLSIGVVGLFLAICSLWEKRETWHKKLFVAGAGVVLLLSIRTPVSELIYRYPWPILSTGTPTRILWIFLLCLSVLAGMGFDALRQSRKARTKGMVTLWLFILLLWGFVFVHPNIDWLTYPASALVTMKRAMILTTAFLGVATVITVCSSYKKILLLGLIPLAAAELLYGFIKFNPFVPPSFVFPDNRVMIKLQQISGIDRYWGYGTGEIEANFATQMHIFSPDGTDPLNLAWYNKFLQSSKEGAIAETFNRTTRSDAYLATGYGPRDLPDNLFRLRIMDALGVKYVLDRAENPKDGSTFAPDRFSNLGNIDDWTLYENRRAAPRFFITSDVRPYTSTKNFETQFFDADFNVSKTILIEKTDFDMLPALVVGTNSAVLNSYSPTKVTITGDTSSPGLLFLSDTYDRGWTAMVNGVPTKVIKANFAFRAVYIPKGASTIVFTYTPKSFRVGLLISLFTLGMTIIYFARKYYKKQ